MFCIQCGTVNDDRSKYCLSCNAILIQPAPEGLPESSTLNLQEEVEYPVPETHYQAPILQQLAWSIHDFLEEDGDLELIVEAYEAYREIFEGFRVELPGLKEYSYSQEGKLEDDPVPSQIRYLVTKAEELYAEGESLFEGYFDLVESLGEDEDFPDPEPLMKATKCWLSCNDNICISFDFLVGRTEAFREMLQEIEETLAVAPAETGLEAEVAVPVDVAEI